MDFKLIAVVASIVLVLVVLKTLGDWVDKSPRLRLAVGSVMVMGAALALQILFPEIVRRLVG